MELSRPSSDRRPDPDDVGSGGQIPSSWAAMDETGRQQFEKVHRKILGRDVNISVLETPL